MSRGIKNIWIKSSIIGSLWASAEIVLGSFLHNLHVPFSGTILAAMSVVLLIAFLQIWPETGIMWRSGIICALMKSISPSAVIIGPMLGIATESFILFLVIFLIGKNVFGYLIGGALAVFSTLIQKIIVLLLLYGWNLVKLAEGMYEYLIRELGNVSLSPFYLILFVSIFYILIGIVAALIGFRAGKRYNLKKGVNKYNFQVRVNKQNNIFELRNGKYSVVNLFTLLIWIVTLLYLINVDRWSIFLPLFISFVFILGFRYKNNMRFFRKISFWIYLLLITVLASMFINGLQTGKYFSTEGLMVGVKMNLRAVIIIMGFTGISVELRNPVIKSILFKGRSQQLYHSLRFSFGILPMLLDDYPSAGKILKKRNVVVQNIIMRSEYLYNHFMQNNTIQYTILLITGPKMSGKTTFVKSLIEHLKRNKIEVGGFYSEADEQEQRRMGFNLVAVKSGEKLRLASIEEQCGWMKKGRYWFDQEVIDTGKQILENDSKSSGIVIVDEVGTMEMRGKGWAPALKKISEQANTIQVWVVNTDNIESLKYQWNKHTYRIFNIRSNTVDDVLEYISQWDV